MKTTTKSLIYKILTIVTLVLPMPIYLIVSATIFNIEPDYIIHEGDHELLTVVLPTEETPGYVVATIGDQFEIEGDVIYKNSQVYMEYNEETIFQVSTTGFLQIEVITLENGSVEMAWVDHTSDLFNKQLSYKLPIAVIFGLVGVGIVALVIMNKMDLLKTRPRTSTMLALAVGTLVLFIIEVIVSNILGVFIVATSMWAAYCIEYMIYNKDTLFTSKGVKSNLQTELSAIIERYK